MAEIQVQASTKRKRSVIACSACHQRKVRCNVAFQGVPCTNCAQDDAKCEIYRRKIGMYVPQLSVRVSDLYEAARDNAKFDRGKLVKMENEFTR